MRSVALCSLIFSLVAAGLVRGDDPSPALPVAEIAKPADETPGADQLADKVSQLEALQAEVAQLRRAAGRETRLVLKVQIVELSHAKTRELGIDVTECLGKTQVHDRDGAAGTLAMLRREGALKVLAEPTLTVSDGRPAHYFSGEEVLCPTTRTGSQGFEHRKVGTEVDLVAIRSGGRRIHLNIRARLSQANPSLGGIVEGVKVPGFRAREIDTALEMELGTTAIFCDGNRLERLPAVDPKTPGEADARDEVETLFLVTPELAADEAK